MSISITSPARDSVVAGTVTVLGQSSVTIKPYGGTPQVLPPQAFKVLFDTTTMPNGNAILVISCDSLIASVRVKVFNPTLSKPGTSVPPAQQIIDAQGNVWTLVAGVVLRNGVAVVVG